MLLPTFSLLLLLLPTLTLSAIPKPPKNAILLSNVKSLTLRSNAITSHRRVAAMPQLTCKGPGCAHHKVDIMRCTNEGSDYSSEDIQWSCKANVPEEFKLGSTDVICEGYASPEDSYVLKGSCGVEYRLLLTDKGEEKFGRGSEKGSILGLLLFMAAFLGVFGWIVWACLTNDGPDAPRRIGYGGNGGWGGGGNGGGGNGGGGGAPGGFDDPPPPYSKPEKPSTTQPGRQGYQPGFWTGALGGAAAAYMARNMGNNRQNDNRHNGGYNRQPGGRTSMWGGGNDNGESSWGSNTAPPRPSPSSSSSSSSARHESTGFGSTTRR